MHQHGRHRHAWLCGLVLSLSARPFCLHVGKMLSLILQGKIRNGVWLLAYDLLTAAAAAAVQRLVLCGAGLQGGCIERSLTRVIVECSPGALAFYFAFIICQLMQLPARHWHVHMGMMLPAAPLWLRVFLVCVCVGAAVPSTPGINPHGCLAGFGCNPLTLGSWRSTFCGQAPLTTLARDLS